MERQHQIVLGGASLVVMVVVGFAFRDRLKHLERYGYLGILLFTLIGNVSIFSPAGPLVTLIAGRFYHPVLVGLVAAVGCVVGEVLAYNVGAAAGLTELEQHEWYETIRAYMDKNGFLTIAAVTAVPNPVFNVAPLMAGAMKYSVWKMLGATFLGNWVQYTITASIGSLTKKIKIKRLF